MPPGLCPVVLFAHVCAYTQSCRQRAGRIEIVSQCRVLSTYYVLGTAVSTPIVVDTSQNPSEVCGIVPNLQKKLGLGYLARKWCLWELGPVQLYLPHRPAQRRYPVGLLEEFSEFFKA